MLPPSGCHTWNIRRRTQRALVRKAHLQTDAQKGVRQIYEVEREAAVSANPEGSSRTQRSSAATDAWFSAYHMSSLLLMSFPYSGLGPSVINASRRINRTERCREPDFDFESFIPNGGDGVSGCGSVSYSEERTLRC